MSAKNIPVKDRRKELTLIAFNHIAKKGFEGLRVRGVAAEAGLNNATLHYYFPTKEDLIKGVVDRMIEKFSTSYGGEPAAQDSPDAWQDAWQDARQDAWTELDAELEDARRSYTTARDELVVFTELLIRSLRDPAIAQIFKKLDESWQGALVGIVERGIRQGIFRAELDPGITATLLMLQIKGFGYQMLGETNQSMADEVFDQLALQVKSWLSGEFKG